MSEVLRHLDIRAIVCSAPPLHPIGGGVEQVECSRCSTSAPLEVEQVAQEMSAIPRSVVNLLAVGWRPTDGPPRILYRPDDSPNRLAGGLGYQDVRALVADGVLTNNWRGPGYGIAIDRPELRELGDFVSDVHQAWERVRDRRRDSGQTYPAAVRFETTDPSI